MKKRMRFQEYARETSRVADQMLAEHDRRVAMMGLLRLKAERLQAVTVIHGNSANDARPEPPEAA